MPKNTGTLGRIEGKVDVLTDLVTAQNKRIDSKVGWAPFGVFVTVFFAVTSFFAKLHLGDS